MSKKKKKPKQPEKSKAPAAPATFPRRLARWGTLGLCAAFVLLCAVGGWYARHPPAWLEQNERSLPGFLTRTLMYFGDRTLMFTDALGWTGHDAVYDCDDPAPEGQVFYAGRPVRVGPPAPTDIKVLDRGEFAVGWSDSLQHPVWVAYHVPPEARFAAGKRPSFRKDSSVSAAPAASVYSRTGYDRGHMAPNRAIATRFGPEAQAKTFLMTNIAPQTPALNRGPWRELEQRIADLWAPCWGEIWVICGAVSPSSNLSRQKLPGTGVDVPECFWMLIVAQAADGVRALAFVLPQNCRYDEFPVHRIVTIDELEKLTGFDLLPAMPSYLQRALQADRPTRMWPIRLRDMFKLMLLRFT